MRAVGARYAALLTVLLVTMAGLVIAWHTSHLLFGIIAGILAMFVVLFSFATNGWRQTSQEGLISSGVSLDAYHVFGSSDPGLRRELELLSPAAIVRTRSAAGPALGRVPTTAPPKPAQNRRRRRQDDTLRPEATLTLAAERREAGVDDVFAALESELVGLFPVKKKVEEIGSLLLVDRARKRFGLSGPRPNLHMCFTGAPGTGKTTVALMMAELLHRLGYLETNNLVHAMRDDLVGQYIGHTAPKTKHVLERAMGGVLFIDEAYTLYRADDSKDFGQECTDILMQVMENERDRLVVILAGYKDRMDQFFECNPGMSSRIAHHLDFAAYQVDELLAIGGRMLDRSSYYMSAEAESVFAEYLRIRMNQPRFAHARSVRNELESARLRHAHRLAGDPGRQLSKDDLMRLEPSDIVPTADFRSGSSLRA